jgi:hypothetical protein
LYVAFPADMLSLFHCEGYSYLFVAGIAMFCLAGAVSCHSDVCVYTYTYISFTIREECPKGIVLCMTRNKKNRILE